MSRPAFLVISSSSPPRSGGTPSILANQFSWFDADFAFVGQTPRGNEWKDNLRPGWTFYGVPAARATHLLPELEFGLVPIIVARAMEAARATKPCALIAVLFGNAYLAAAITVAQITGLPLILYVADFWADVPLEAGGPRMHRIGSTLQRRLLARADLAVTNIPGIARYFRSHHGHELVVAQNCYPKGVAPLNATPRTADPKAVSVAFCGNVYWNNADRLRALCAALRKVSGARLTIYGSQSRERLRERGLDPALDVEIRFIEHPSALLLELQRHDVLFMPFTFAQEQGRELIAEAAFPTKVLDYLGAARPILVNCPADSDLARFFMEQRCGEVVTDPSSDALAAAITAIRNQPERAARLSAEAAKAAERFIGSAVLREFALRLEAITGKRVMSWQ